MVSQSSDQTSANVDGPQTNGWFLLGLFLTTLATLALEILNTRLLSVLTWYHLSFFAVSVAMFGMAAGAVHVYLSGHRFVGERAREALGRLGTAFAIALAASHIAVLNIPIRGELSIASIVAVGLTTILLSVPFYLSGTLVAIALTRLPARIGLTYAVDLLGAAAGSLLILPLLAAGSISAAVLACAAVAAAGAASFQVFARRRSWLPSCLALVFVVLAVLDSTSGLHLRVQYPKGVLLASEDVAYEYWTIHGQVVAMQPATGVPMFWGAGEGAHDYSVESVMMVIDGAAGTSMTGWDGSTASIGWVQHDVTSLPYHLRRGGDVAVIGVGGGRDLLTALWAESRSVLGIEINSAFIDLLDGPLRDFAGIVVRPEVRLVHDEARSYLTRTEARFDVLQMSLVDTWAATGAGAFTLSENGLYTTEAWGVFLEALKPRGIFSVSRWYAPNDASETSRLISLAVASLVRRGVEDPSAHIALVARENVATLLISAEPLDATDLQTLEETCQRFGFAILIAPGQPAQHALLGRIAASRSLDDLMAVVGDQEFDYTPPSDDRPYFFNLVRPRQLFSGEASQAAGVVSGNMVATSTLIGIVVLIAVLVAAVIAGPLLWSGLPSLYPLEFGAATLYFSLIGTGFMLIQISFMQRFSVYLGHPTYTLAVILFSMILATGLGSLLSDRISLASEQRSVWVLPLATAAGLAGLTSAIPTVLEATIHLGLWRRCLIVVGMVVPISGVLGTYFPLGMRLVDRLSDDAKPWMWGVNGGCGVLASVAAIAISMWFGIHTCLYLAAGAYALVLIPGRLLRRRGFASQGDELAPQSR